MKLLLESDYDFHTGVPVSPKEMHEEVLKAFEDDPRLKNRTLRTGKTAIFGIRWKSGVVDIFEITEGYKYFSYKPKS